MRALVLGACVFVVLLLLPFLVPSTGQAGQRAIPAVETLIVPTPSVTPLADWPNGPDVIFRFYLPLVRGE